MSSKKALEVYQRENKTFVMDSPNIFQNLRSLSPESITHIRCIRFIWNSEPAGYLKVPNQRPGQQDVLTMFTHRIKLVLVLPVKSHYVSSRQTDDWVIAARWLCNNQLLPEEYHIQLEIGFRQVLERQNFTTRRPGERPRFRNPVLSWLGGPREWVTGTVGMSKGTVLKWKVRGMVTDKDI